MDEKRLNEQLIELNKQYLSLLSSREYRLGEKLLKAKSAWKKMDLRAFGIGILHSVAERKMKKLEGANRGFLTYHDDAEIPEKCVVYTCIAGDYDEILEPVYVPAGVEFRVVTNQPVPAGSCWKPLSLSQISEITGLDDTRKARYVKTHPHVLFPQYEYSIWVDSNIRIVGDVTGLFRSLGNIPFASNWHPLRNCIYQEAKACVLKGKEQKNILEIQTTKYSREGMPEKFGLVETNMLVRRHQDATCVQLMEDWWTEILKYSKRDQISLPYVIWKSGKQMEDIGFIGMDIRQNPAVQVHIHKATYRCHMD